jgi:RNA polymerase sigma-70 factor (ECF subfamily)
MASAPVPGLSDKLLSAAVRKFAAEHYEASGAREFGMDEAALATLLAEVAAHRERAASEVPEHSFLASIRLEELVLARACADGNDRAWEVFLTRYRETLYESAYKLSKEESAARSLADSLYAELYGVNAEGRQRASKLRYYSGRGSLQGWLRTVVAQEYVNRYRSGKRESSLDAAVEDGAQFSAPEAETPVLDDRVVACVNKELAELGADERFLLAAYYLDRRTLAEIARLQGVHESTISRKLERTTAGLRKRICKRLMQSGMSKRQAEEAMEVDVRDLNVRVSETLRQGTADSAFYKKRGETGG